MHVKCFYFPAEVSSMKESIKVLEKEINELQLVTSVKPRMSIDHIRDSSEKVSRCPFGGFVYLILYHAPVS